MNFSTGFAKTSFDMKYYLTFNKCIVLHSLKRKFLFNPVTIKNYSISIPKPFILFYGKHFSIMNLITHQNYWGRKYLGQDRLIELLLLQAGFQFILQDWLIPQVLLFNP